MYLLACVRVCVSVQGEKAKPIAGLSLFASDELFASADDSPTFDLFAPAAVRILFVIGFIHLFAVKSQTSVQSNLLHASR